MDIRLFRHQLRRLERRLDSALQSGINCCGVTLVQCHTILAIRDHGPLSMTELADHMELDKSTVSRTVDGLVKDGLVDRAVKPDNRRAVNLDMTPKGRREADRIHTLCDTSFSRILEKLTKDEAETVLKGITLLANALDESMTDGTCCAMPGTGVPS